MIDGWFSKPIAVSVGISGSIQNVLNARQAAELLARHWPDAGTEKHRNAHHTCLEVLNGRKAPELAREAFVAAAREANILVEY